MANDAPESPQPAASASVPNPMGFLKGLVNVVDSAAARIVQVGQTADQKASEATAKGVNTVTTAATGEPAASDAPKTYTAGDLASGIWSWGKKQAEAMTSTPAVAAPAATPQVNMDRLQHVTGVLDGLQAKEVIPTGAGTPQCNAALQGYQQAAAKMQKEVVVPPEMRGRADKMTQTERMEGLAKDPRNVPAVENLMAAGNTLIGQCNMQDRATGARIPAYKGPR